MVGVFLFKTTTVSLYCNRTILSAEGVKALFHKIYYLTMPVGFLCVAITGKDTILKCLRAHRCTN